MATIDTIADRSTGSAIAGKAYFETSTNKFIVYNGSAWIEIDSDGTGAIIFENRWAMDCSASGVNELKVAGTSDIILQDSFTIATWFKTPSSITSWSGLINWGHNAVGYGRGLGFNSTGRLHFNGYGTHHTSTSGTTLSGNTWYHGVAVVSAINSSFNATATVYLNGQLDSVANGGLNLFNLNNYVHHEIGHGPYPNATHAFDGQIDEVALFNAELSALDVAAMYNGTAPNGVPVDLTNSASYNTDRTSNLVGYWRMGDDSGDSPVDAGNITSIVNTANPGTNDATTIGSTQPTFKALAQSTTTSVSFDGSNDYLEVPHSTDLELTTAMTWSAWVNMNTTQTVDYPYIFAKWDAPSAEYNYTFYTHTEVAGGGVGAGHFRMRYWDGSSANSSNTDIPRGQWVHLAGVHNGTQLTYYVNGVADNTINVTTGSTNTGNLIIGRAPNDQRTFPGEIDEAAIFNSALSASDVASLASSRGAHVVNDLSLSPTAYYRMGEDDSLAAGDTVTGITDASGNGNDATTVAANQPTASVDPIIYV